MKFKVSFKTPDAITDALGNVEDEDNYDQALEFARKFVKYDEYLTVEFDTDANTCTVLKVNEV